MPLPAPPRLRLAVCLSLLLGAPASPAPPDLARPLLGGRPVPAETTDPAAIRAEARTIDVGALLALSPGDRVELNLFDDVTLQGAVSRGGHLLSGVVEGAGGGTWTMVVHDDAVSGIIRAPGVGLFRVRAGALGHATVIELDEAAFAPCSDTPPAAPPAVHQPVGAGQGGCSDGSVIDVVVVYTPLARDLIGGPAAMVAEIDLAIALTNDAYANSGIGLELNLVHSEEVDYDESGSFSEHLGQLGDDNDGIMDEVHGMRYVYQADMVALLVADFQLCGIAWLMPTNGPASESTAFSVTNVTCAAGNLTFAHELGHNMGCCHAPGDGGGCVSGGLFPYSVGYRYNGNSGTLWRTVMAYSPGARIPNFSNPLVLFDGQPTGLPAASPDGADNASTIEQTRPTIASYRCGLPFCDYQAFGAVEAGPGDGLGVSVALDGGVLISGASFDDGAAPYAGAAFVYRYDEAGDAWQQEARLAPGELAESDLFGNAVGVSGDDAIVGALGHDAAGDSAGAAWLYHFDGAGWVQQIEIDGLAAGDQFGAAVAIDGDVAVVGAPQADGLAPSSGAVFVYRRDGAAAWMPEQTIPAAEGLAGGLFGQDVAVDGDRLIAGAPLVNPAGQTGKAHVYHYADGTWQLEGTLEPPIAAGYTGFGSAVDLDGDVAVVGAPSDDHAGPDAGSVYVFHRVGGAWVFAQQLSPAGLSPHDAYGSAVAVDGRTIVAGGTGDNDHGPGSGSAYAYRYDGAAWQLRGKLLSLDGAEFDLFGNDAAIDGLTIATGAFNTAAGGTVYVYRGLSGDDCNGNGVDDDCEILAGDVNDTNGNGVPDDCETPGDLDGDGTVGVTDMLALLAMWGPCADCGSCPADLDGDCDVGTTDFLALLANWS